MPDTSGYANYAAMQSDALRRLDRAERRAQKAVEYDNSNYDTEDHPSPANHAVSGKYSVQAAVQSQMSNNMPVFQSDFVQHPHARADDEPRHRASRDTVRAFSSPPGGETGEQIFLLLLIILLIREKSDPCLIAALVYLML